MRKAILGLIIWFFLTGVAVAEEKRITIANLAWLPYSGQFLPKYGIAPEIITEAFSRVGYKVEYNFMAWTLALDEVKKGSFDAIGTAYFTKEREKIYQFSDPYMDSPIVFFKRKDSRVGWNGNIEDLKDYKIGVIKGYANSPEFDKADFLRKAVSRTEVLLLKKLLYKQADMIAMDQFVGIYNINEKLVGYDKYKLEPIQPPLIVNKLYLMFSRKVPGFMQKSMDFNTGLSKIRKDGTLNSILVRHGFGK